MKKNLLVFILSLFTLGVFAQFGKLPKAKNIEAGKKLLKAVTLSDEEMKTLALQSVDWMDENNPVADENDDLTLRLNSLVKDLKNVDGLDLNYKVYLVEEVNAFASPDGSVRVMAGLLDLMTDDEVLSVIGHEIGHVKLGHSKKQYQAAYAISAAKDAAIANTKAGTILEIAELGNFVENLLNSPFSKSHETAADKYGFDFLVKHGFDYHAMESTFLKLAELSDSGGKGSFLSSHPGEAKRAKLAKKWAEEQDNLK